jgi:hypothetical protein
MKTQQQLQTEIDRYYQWMREASLEGNRQSEDFFHSMALDAQQELEDLQAGRPSAPDILQMIRRRENTKNERH